MVLNGHPRQYDTLWVPISLPKNSTVSTKHNPEDARTDFGRWNDYMVCDRNRLALLAIQFHVESGFPRGVVESGSAAWEPICTMLKVSGIGALNRHMHNRVCMCGRLAVAACPHNRTDTGGEPTAVIHRHRPRRRPHDRHKHSDV